MHIVFVVLECLFKVIQGQRRKRRQFSRKRHSGWITFCVLCVSLTTFHNNVERRAVSLRQLIFVFYFVWEVLSYWTTNCRDLFTILCTFSHTHETRRIIICSLVGTNNIIYRPEVMEGNAVEVNHVYSEVRITDYACCTYLLISCCHSCCQESCRVQSHSGFRR